MRRSGAIEKRLLCLLLTALLSLVPALCAFAQSGSDISSSDVSSGDVSSGDVAPVGPSSSDLGAVAAKSALLYDATYGKLLFELNADEAAPPASTTKIMTALLVIEAVNDGLITLDETVTAGADELASIPWDASSVNPKIQAGEDMSVRDYLYCVMLTSDCACCNVLAKHISGSTELFVEKMNARAAELGCAGTTFKNSHGYPEEGHTASARSLLMITLEAMKHDSFREISNTLSYTIQSTNKSVERKLVNTNHLLDPLSLYYYDKAKGTKTGYAKAAGYCLVSSATMNNRELVAVVLGAEKYTEDGATVLGSFVEAKKLLEWGFTAFQFRSIAEQGYTATQIPLSGSTASHLTLIYEQSAQALLPADIDDAQLQVEFKLYSRAAVAPVTAGDDYGVAEISYNGELLASVPIGAGTDAPVKEPINNGVILAVLAGLVLMVSCVVITLKKTRRRDSYSYDIVSPSDYKMKPQDYPYGGSPLYKRKRPTIRGGDYAREILEERGDPRGAYGARGPYDVYSDYGEDYYDDSAEPDYYRDYGGERERDYDRAGESRRIEPVFPRDGNWRPLSGGKQ